MGKNNGPRSGLVWGKIFDAKRQYVGTNCGPRSGLVWGKIHGAELENQDNNSLRFGIEKAQLLANGQSECERQNSKINRYKTKLSSNIGTNMMKARSRSGSNGPPFHLFKPDEVFAYWIKHNHRLAEKVKQSSVSFSKVLKTKRKKAEEKYTTKIFD